MATLAATEVGLAGAAPAAAAASGGGDKFTPDNDTYLVVTNGGGGAITVTVATPGSDALGLAEADVAVNVPAGATRHIGPFPAEHFEDPTDHLAHITYSGVVTVAVSVMRLKPISG